MPASPPWHFSQKIYLFIYLKCKVPEKEWKRVISFLMCSFPQCLQQPGEGQVEARSWELCLHLTGAHTLVPTPFAFPRAFAGTCLWSRATETSVRSWICDVKTASGTIPAPKCFCCSTVGIWSSRRGMDGCQGAMRELHYFMNAIGWPELPLSVPDSHFSSGGQWEGSGLHGLCSSSALSLVNLWPLFTFLQTF